MSTTANHKRRPPAPTYVSVNEAAEYLGSTPRYIRAQIKAGRIPAYRLSPRSTRVKMSDLEAALEPVAVADIA